MKKILLLVALITFLVGCEEVPMDVVEVPAGGDRFNGLNVNEIKIITDSETGCKYIFAKNIAGYSSTAAMSPLYKSSNEVDCD